MLQLLLAAAVVMSPPVDGDGAYLHAVTLEPSSLVHPGAAEKLARFKAWGLHPDGSLLLVNQGDVIVVEPTGRIVRGTYDAVDEYLWADAELVFDEQGLWYCDNRLGVSRVVRETGEVTHLGGFDEPLPGGCGLFLKAGDGPGGAGWFAWLGGLAHRHVYELDAEGRIYDEGPLPAHVVIDHDPPLSQAPCGPSTRGRPMAVQADETFQRLRLVELDDHLLPAETLWEIAPPGRPERDALAGAQAWMPSACSSTDGITTLVYLHEIFVYGPDGELLSAIRNGAPLAAKPRPTKGSGGYAVDMVDWSGPLGSGGTFAVVEGYHGRLKLFAPRDAEVADDADHRELAVSYAEQGEFTLAQWAWSRWLADHPDDGEALVARADNMLAAGWWAEVVSEWKQHRDTVDEITERQLYRLAVLARARSLTRWSSRHLPEAGNVPFGSPADPVQLATEYHEEMTGCLADLPDEPDLQLAVARLSFRAGRPYTRLSAIQRYLELVPEGGGDIAGGGADPAAVYDLYALYAHRGDVESMRAAVEARGEDAPTSWRVMLLRAEGRHEEALQLLEGFEGWRALVMRARLQSDLGRLDESIAIWTEALQAGAEHDAAAHAGLGADYLRRGLVELAVEQFLEARALEPDDSSLAANLALAYSTLDRREQAQEVLEQALSSNPDDPLLEYQSRQIEAPARKGKGRKGAVAVMPFDVAGGSVQRVGLGDFAATMLVTHLSSSTSHKVVERSRLDAVLAEQDLQTTHHVDADTAVTLGKLLGARKLVLGNVAEYADRVDIDLRVVDVKTGRVLAASATSAPLEPEALRTALATLAAETLG